jgi:hypothetical protein
VGFLSHDGTLELNFPPDHVFEALAEATPLAGLQIEHVDADRREIIAKTGASLTSWGERLTISVEPIADGRTRVIARSASRGGFLAQGVTDLGRNKKHVEKILQETSRILHAMPASARSAHPSARQRLGELAKLRDEQLITSDEFEAKRREILNEL